MFTCALVSFFIAVFIEIFHLYLYDDFVVSLTISIYYLLGILANVFKAQYDDKKNNTFDLIKNIIFIIQPFILLFLYDKNNISDIKYFKELISIYVIYTISMIYFTQNYYNNDYYEKKNINDKIYVLYIIFNFLASSILIKDKSILVYLKLHHFILLTFSLLINDFNDSCLIYYFQSFYNAVILYVKYLDI
tara:strand:- start:949 stop:1521 length:573 start_codon:yes stop_codon:yes gene_type:complete